MQLPREISSFFCRQGYIVTSTIDRNGHIHSVAKSIVGTDEEQGKVYIVDLYQGETYRNLQKNAVISITAVDEHHFLGYTLKGKAHIVPKENIAPDILHKWEEKVVQRLSRRVTKNVKDYKKTGYHPESRFNDPEHLIVVDVQEIVDLTHAHLKK